MSLVSRLIPGHRPPYRAQDYVSERLVGRTFVDVLAQLERELYDPSRNEGRYILYNVGPLATAGKLDVIAIGETQADAEDGLERRLGELLR